LITFGVLSVIIFFICSFDLEGKGNGPDAGQADDSKNYAADSSMWSAENIADEIKIKKAYCTPIERSDDHQNQHSFVKFVE
jgi:hypothetical protein